MVGTIRASDEAIWFVMEHYRNNPQATRGRVADYLNDLFPRYGYSGRWKENSIPVLQEHAVDPRWTLKNPPPRGWYRTQIARGNQIAASRANQAQKQSNKSKSRQTANISLDRQQLRPNVSPNNTVDAFSQQVCSSWQRKYSHDLSQNVFNNLEQGAEGTIITQPQASIAAEYIPDVFLVEEVPHRQYSFPDCCRPQSQLLDDTPKLVNTPPQIPISPIILNLSDPNPQQHDSFGVQQFPTGSPLARTSTHQVYHAHSPLNTALTQGLQSSSVAYQQHCQLPPASKPSPKTSSSQVTNLTRTINFIDVTGHAMNNSKTISDNMLANLSKLLLTIKNSQENGDTMHPDIEIRVPLLKRVVRHYEQYFLSKVQDGSSKDVSDSRQMANSALGVSSNQIP